MPHDKFVEQYTVVRFLLFGLLVVSCFLTAGCGGGGGSSGTVNLDIDVSAYENWLDTTLAEQKAIVEDNSADFVDVGGSESSNLLTNLLGWVRVGGDSSIDQLRRWSSSPQRAEELLADATNSFDTRGKSIEFTKEFSSSSTTGLNIPIISAFLNFSKTKEIGGKYTLTIKYGSAKTFWLSEVGLRKLLKEGDFTEEFLGDVQNGKVKIFRGVLALHDVEIRLSISASGSGNIKIGDVFEDGQSGIIFNVDSKSSTATTTTVTLKVPDDLMVGISQKTLSATDLGHVVSSNNVLAGNTPLVVNYDYNPATVSGHFTLRNEGNDSLRQLLLTHVVEYETPSGEVKPAIIGSDWVSNSYPAQTSRFPLDIGSLPVGKIRAIRCYPMQWLGAGQELIHPRAGPYVGTIYYPDIGLSFSKEIFGIISANGSVLFFESENHTRLFWGAANLNGGCSLKLEPNSTPVETSLVEQEGDVVVYFGDVRAQFRLNYGTSAP